MAYLTDSERKLAGKQSYELHLDGLRDDVIADRLGIDLWQVTQLRDQYATTVPTPEQAAARSTAIARAEHDLQELATWQERLHSAYQSGSIDIEKAGNLAARLVKTRTDVGVRYAKLLDLDSPLSLKITSHSEVDEAILALSRQVGAAQEEDAELSW